MSLDALAQTLTLQAEQTAAEERERTAREIEQIVADATRERDRRREVARTQLEREYRGEMRARLARVQRDARHRMLQSRATLVKRVLACVDSELAGFERRPELVELVPELLRQALDYVGDEPVEVRCPRSLRGVVDKLSLSQRGISVVEDGDVGVGISVRTLDGSVTVDNTMQARLHRASDELAIELVRRFDQGTCRTGVT